MKKELSLNLTIQNNFGRISNNEYEKFFIRKTMTKKDFFALVEKYAKRTDFYLTWDKLSFDEYIDYLMGRELIQKNLDILKDNQELLAKLALADERLKNATIELDFPLYHKENLDKEKYCFLYRLLPEKKSNGKFIYHGNSFILCPW